MARRLRERPFQLKRVRRPRLARGPPSALGAARGLRGRWLAPGCEEGTEAAHVGLPCHFALGTRMPSPYRRPPQPSPLCSISAPLPSPPHPFQMRSPTSSLRSPSPLLQTSRRTTCCSRFVWRVSSPKCAARAPFASSPSSSANTSAWRSKMPHSPTRQTARASWASTGAPSGQGRQTRLGRGRGEHPPLLA